MPSQYMPYRPGDLLKATDVNTLLASVPFYTNNGSMGIGTNSVMVTPTENSVWINVTKSIVTNKIRQDAIHPYGVIYGVPRQGVSFNSSDNSGKEGQGCFGNWDFYSKRPNKTICQAFYTLTGVMSPVGMVQDVPADQSLPQAGPEQMLGDQGDGETQGSQTGSDQGTSGETTTQTTHLGDMTTPFRKGSGLTPQSLGMISYQQSAALNNQGMPTPDVPPVADTLSDQLFVLAIPMVPGERYVLDVHNNFDDEPLSPGEEYVYDAETNRLKRVKNSEASSDMVVHRRRYHPKTDAYTRGMDPRFSLGDDNLIWCGGEGYFSGHVGNPLDPPPGFEIGPIYRVEYDGEVFVGKFSLQNSSFWNIATGYIVPGWVDKDTGLSVFHPSSSSSDGLLQAAGPNDPILGDEPNSTGDESEPTDATDNTQDQKDTEIIIGSSFAKHTEDQKSCLAEIVYTPIATAEVVEKEEEPTLGTVRLPISSVLIQAMAVPPRIDAPLDAKGHTLFDRLTEEDDEEDGGETDSTDENEEQENTGSVSFPDFEKEGSKAVAYSFLVAKTLGLVEPAGSVPSYQQAYYSAEDTTRPFCKKIFINKTTSSVTLGKIKEAVAESGWSNIQIKDRKLFREGGEGEQDEYICFGTYEPDELRTSEPIYFDMLSSSNRLYIQRVEADHFKNNSYARYVPLLKKDSNSDTCGWIRYRYYDEIESNQKAETVTLSVPSVLGSSVSVSENTWEVNGEEYDPVMFTPFWSEYGMGYGYARTESINPSTKEATILYYPFKAEPDNEEQSEQEQQSQTVQTGSVPSYDQYHSFPFFFSGLSLPKRARLTTKQYKAQRSDWVPAICTTLDHNEVLIPGMVVPITDTNTTINGQTFHYLTVTPPESYSTALEGTPNEVVYKVSYRAPSPSDIEESIIKEDDCWVTGIKKLDDDAAIPANPPSGTVYRVGIKLKADTGAPDIAEPFGAFNNCDNRGSMTVFLRTTAWGINYTCTARLDHIPFGYAVPSKTPSCYYKSGNDPCAASLVSQRFLVKRIEADNRLYLTGACYVPCSTLSSFN